MDETKKKFALWAYPTTLEKVERLYQLDNCRSKSEFIEKAVLFYAGYVCAEDCREYFPEAIVSTIQGSLVSVSYTHLDVYKRQVQYRTVLSGSVKSF